MLPPALAFTSARMIHGAMPAGFHTFLRKFQAETSLLCMLCTEFDTSSTVATGLNPECDGTQQVKLCSCSMQTQP